MMNGPRDIPRRQNKLFYLKTNAESTLLKIDAFFSRKWPAVMLILLTGAIAYANTFQVPFTLDDDQSIADNPDEG